MKSQPAKQAVSRNKPPAPAAPQAQAAAPPASAPTARPAFWPVVVTGLLFAAWIGYLVSLVVSMPKGPAGTPVLLSRPQFLVADLLVIAQVDSLNGPVVVKEMIYPNSAEGGLPPGERIIVTNLEQCRPSSHGRDLEEPPADFTGPGLYILPLRPLRYVSDALSLKAAAGWVGLLGDPLCSGPLLAASFPSPEVLASCYEVVATPPSPGYPPQRPLKPGPPRLYPANEETRAQLKQILSTLEKRDREAREPLK